MESFRYRTRTSVIRRLFAKWGLNAVEIGRVTDDGLMRVNDGADVVAEIPVSALTDEAPIYRRPVKRPAKLAKTQRLSLRTIPQPRDYGATLLTLLASPTIANKAMVFEQYDHMVQTNTVVLPGRADAAVLRLKGTETLLAATTDGNGRYCALDPYEGGKHAVAEAARNLACVGATPLAVTDCLNFGNPEDPGVMWQFKECVRGISEACRVFGTPVTGGNVSFYNESPRGAINPTPVIGMIGLVEIRSWKLEARKNEIQPPRPAWGARGRGGPASPARLGSSGPGRASLQPITANFKDEGDVILLLGTTREELGGSEYLHLIHRRKQGKPPRVNLQAERRLQQVLVEANRLGLLKSAHDCSEGGLAVALAECCVMEEEYLVGATLEFGVRRSTFIVKTTNNEQRTMNIRMDTLLFGESAARVIVTCERFHQPHLEALARRRKVPSRALGRVGGRRFIINPWIDLPLEALDDAWRNSLARSLS